MNLISTASGTAPEIKDWLVKRGLDGDSVAQLVLRRGGEVFKFPGLPGQWALYSLPSSGRKAP